MNSSMDRETRAQSKASGVLLRVFAGIGGVATIALLWLGYSTMWPVGHLATPGDSRPLVTREDERMFSVGDPVSGVVQARLLKFGPGRIDVTPGSVLIADEVRMDGQTVLRAPSLTILARRLTGGRVDASGSDENAAAMVQPRSSSISSR